MKICKNLLRLSIVLSILSVQSCTFISSAGFSSKGLPAKEVPRNLTSTTARSAVNLDHSRWDKLLKKHVDSNGNVDYKAFQKDKKELGRYLEMLSQNKPTDQWSVQEQLAYYINLYNANTVNLILDNYPLKSIKDLSGPWTRGFIKVGDTEMSLGGIENSILRKMNEPRIHFAINCASISCPNLYNEAFTAAKINEQLDQVTKDFINSNKNDIQPNAAQLSSIFDWYQKDFLVHGIKSVREYVNLYSNTKIKKDAKISYKEYDWNLNKQK